MNTVYADILSPEKIFFSGEVEQLIFATPEGSMGIMAGYMPIIAAVADGILEIDAAGERKIAAVGQGFCIVSENKASFYLDTVEWADEIDAVRAREALHRAELRARSNLSQVEMLRAQAAMSRALARLKAVEWGKAFTQQ